MRQFADLDLIAGFIKRQASIDIARKWFASMIGAIESLGAMPTRCPMAPEAEELGDDIRLLLHGQKNRAYKIYFRILQRGSLGDAVQVFHIRH